MAVLYKTLLFALFVVIDPFGLASTTSDVSTRFVHRAIAIFGVPDVEPRPVAVVLVDDRSAAAINAQFGYPITFAQHAAVLKPLLCAQPAALFIDISFRGLRPDDKDADIAGTDEGLQDLLDVLGGKAESFKDHCRRLNIETAPAATPPVVAIVRSRSNPPNDCDPLFELPLPLHCRAGRQIDRLSSVARPLSVSPVQADGTYPLVLENGASANRKPSPALALLLAYCERANWDTARAFKGCRDMERLKALLDPAATPEIARIIPFWTFYQSQSWLDDQRRFESAGGDVAGDRCKAQQSEAGRPLLARIQIISAEFWQTLLGIGSGGARLFGTGLCISTDTFGALDVRQMATFCGEDGKACAQRLSAFFSGRMVVYGADITGINDTVSSPVLGLVPGAAYHATVAENLLWMGADFPSTAPLWLGDRIGLSLHAALDIVAFALTAGALSLLALSQARWGGTLAAAVSAVALSLSALNLALAFPLLPIEKSMAGSTILLAWLTGLAAVGGRQAASTTLIRIGRWFTRLSFALLILIGWTTLVYWFLPVPPANIIATILLAATLVDTAPPAETE